ncbi:hypothetical protein ACFVFQ_10680 [Streptomyces sp. NPDC057743]|uniref:hypothetical protein n=1 Tax=Streptomyces sp. NPDC057743 TaxID=3346236 RepID=UPI0036BC472E
MSVSVEVYRERGATAERWVEEHWANERTCAVVVAREAGAVVGSVGVVDLGAEDPDLRFVGLVDGSLDVRAPLLRAAAPVVREAGGRTLRWVEEGGELPLAVAAALEELGAVAGDEVYRWWRRELAATLPDAPMSRPAERPTTEGAPFRVAVGDAWCDVEVEGDRAVLAHNRQEEGTSEALAALVSMAVRRVSGEHAGVRVVETFVAPEDEVYETALVSLGFAPTTRRAVEYHMALPG